jgi:small neutral amino acid transporter SnatA (MarC family)
LAAPGLALLINLVIFWAVMYWARHFTRLIGEQGMEILSRVMGLLLVAIAIEMIRNAWALL